MTIFHLMLIPQPESSGASNGHWLWSMMIWMIPFLAIYFWHWWHDHRHNHILEKRLTEIVERLDRILENDRKRDHP